jgi:hypothetical protein
MAGGDDIANQLQHSDNDSHPIASKARGAKRKREPSLNSSDDDTDTDAGVERVEFQCGHIG